MSRPNRVGSEGCGVTLTRRLLPQAPGLLANSVSEPPDATAVARPVVFPTLMIDGADEDQTAAGVVVLLSDIVAVAVSATV
jgi:hypothetical protein